MLAHIQGGEAPQPPIAVLDAYIVGNRTLAIPAPGVLSNDSDINGDPLTAIKASDPGHGSLQLNADGSFTYTSAPGYSGQDSFSYKAWDGNGNWFFPASMPTGREATCGYAVNGKVYVIGGFKSSALNTVEEYDPITNTWSTKAPMPTARYGFAGAVVYGKIHIVGGYSTSYVAAHEVYDPDLNLWSSKAALPTPRSEACAAVANGKFHVIGGRNGASPPANILNLNEVYDPVTDVWTTMNPMPTPRFHACAGAYGGKIYVIGGGTTNPALTWYDANEEYDPIGDSWTGKAPVPVLLGGARLDILADRLFVAGGVNASGNLNNLQSFDSRANTWAAHAPLPTARYTAAVAAMGDTLYVVGGSPAFSTHEAYTISVSNTVSVLLNVHPPSSDFDGDHKSDILFRDSSSGDAVLWLMR